MTYADTSILVAYYCPEPLSASAQAALLAADDPAVSVLCELEFASALAEKVRGRLMAARAAAQARDLFHAQIVARSWRRLPIERTHWQQAESWPASFKIALHTLDAFHLAIAAAHRARLLTADRVLAKAAEILRLAVRLIA